MQLSSGGDYEHIGIATRSATFLLGKAVSLCAMRFVPVCSSIIISCNKVSSTHYLHDTTQSVPGDSHVIALVWALKKVIRGTCLVTKIYYNGRKLLQIE